MKYSIIDKISNVLALSAKNDKHSYDYSWNADSVTERFIQVSNQLSGEEYLGWQLCFDEDGHYHSSAFSKEGVMITKEDIEWIFYDYAAVSGSDQDLFTDKFHGSGILYYLSSSSVPNSRMKKRLLKERIDYFKDVLSALKESKAAVRIIASPEGSGKGIIFFSLPEKMTLRMKTILSFAFTDMTPVEADSEAIIPASAMVSSDRLSIVLQGLLEAFYYERPVEKATENPDVDEHTSDTEIYIADDSDDIPETKSASITIDESSSIDELELSVRSFNCLKRAGVETVGQLRSMAEDDLRRIRNLSRKCVDEIIAKLKEYKPVCSSVTKPTLTYMEMLDELIGLKNVKEQVGKIVALAKMKKDIASKEISEIPIVLNMEFVGNPGTAKTTVARILAGLLYENGLLQSNEIVEVGRADLIAKYIGQTADKVKSIFCKAKGKLLFIDEAYSLVENSRGEYGDEAINTIVQEMENNRSDTIVIFAGYPDEMKEFFSRNPGLRSRVPFSISFCDYTPEEMVRITEIEAKKRGFSITSGAKDKIASVCEISSGSMESGNGRFCRNLIEGAILNYASRVYGNAVETGCKDFTLTENDFAVPDTFSSSESKTPIGFRI